MKKQVIFKRIWVFALTTAFLSTSTVVHHINVDAASAKMVKSVTLKVNSEKVSGKTLTLKQGEKVSVKVSVKPSAAKKSISYKSSNKNIAKVNKKGIITAKKVGTSKITVTVTGKNKKKKSTHLKVNVEEQKQEIAPTNSVPDITTPSTITTDTTTPSDTKPNNQAEGVPVTKWEDQIKSWQYSTLEFNGNIYQGDSFCIEQTSLGKVLGNAVVSGIDDGNIRRTASVEVYEISSINNVCAIAVKFNEKESYVYVNHLYKPDTLETFIKDLSLKENLQIGTVYDSQSNQLEGIKSEDVIAVLFADAKNVERVENINQTRHKRIMSMSVNLPQLGCDNLAFTILEDGYVTTNVMCRIGQTFYVGTEKVDAFVNYILQNTEIDLVDASANPNVNQGENSVENSKE